jgi:predicted ATP-dependent endonuclease of OLD family
MKIDSIKLKNFRGYRTETEIEFNDLTVFVGKK